MIEEVIVTKTQLKDLSTFVANHPAWPEVIRQVAIKHFKEFREADTFEKQQMAAAKNNVLSEVMKEINVIFDQYRDIAE